MTRQEFTRKTKRHIFDRANDKCERCKAALKTGEGEYDHVLPCALGGDNKPANGQLICNICHKDKTKKDVRKTRKADRARDRQSGALKTKNKISGKGFQKFKKAKRFEMPELPRRSIYGDTNVS